MTDDPTDVPENVRDLVAGCVRFVKQATGVELDLTQDTLPLLDHWVRMTPDRPAEEVLGLIAPMAGAYFGEVLRRHLPGARWHAPGDDYAEWRIELRSCRVSFNPIGIAVEAATQDDAEGWGAHLAIPDHDRDLVESALAQQGDVDADDYYRFAVRFEVIESVCELLGARAANRKLN